MQELSLNILDIAQNSVVANASLVEITVNEQPAQDCLEILVKDNGKGMTSEQVQCVTDPFYTTRTTRKVGLGIPFLKMAAQMTGGNLDISSEVGKGTLIHATFGLSHIDRMPMGDIAGTICALIQCNPDITFVYTYRRGNREFCADTREFAQVLDGVSLQEPQVLSFIGDYIRENTAEILAQDTK